MYQEFVDREERELRLRIIKASLADIATFKRSAAPVKASAALKPELRGVYHRTGVDGSVTFEVVDSDGVVQFELKPAQIHCNQRTVRWLGTVLDAIDPPRGRLRAI